MAEEQQKGKPTSVGQYYLMEKVAQGGMAEIFKGLSYDVHGLKKTVCIKKILPQLAANQEFINSLIDEAKLAVKLVHGNIAQTFDLGKVGDDYFMVMEYVDGKSLSQINKKCLAGGKLIPVQFLAYFVSEMLNGLNYMHMRTDDAGGPLHIVHRDISPQNIMVSYSGTVKIIDFGIAKAIYHVGATDSGILKGKFAYMSPEQALGEAVDQRSDVFSVGIILHEMLTGKRLFKAEDSRETIRNVRRSKVSPPSAIRSEIPDELDRITMKALSKDRRHRYPFASDMHDDLVKFLHTTYPEFKSSDAATFVQHLFRDEFNVPEKLEADSKTPHLIIDRSNSALADDSQFEATGRARAPVNMDEYMLEETTGKAAGTPEEDEAGESPSHLPPIEATGAGKKILGMGPRQAKRLRLGLLAFSGIVLAATAAYSVAKHLHTQKTPVIEAAAPVAMPATIIVTTTPADARILLDGVPSGQGSPVTITNVVPDFDHTVEVARDGFVAQTRPLRLSAGETQSFGFVLQPATPPTAKIEIVSQPAGATVYIDDRETALRTPAKFDMTELGREHTIGLYLAGHRFWSKPVGPKGGETKSFDVTLAKDFGSVSIDSNPEKALVMIDGAPAGQTPLTRENLEPGQVYKIELWLEGHKPFVQELKADAGRKEEIRAVLEPEPK